MTPHPDEPTDRTEPEDVEQAVVETLEEMLVAGGPSSVEELAERLAAEFPRLAAGLLADRPGASLADRLNTLTRHADAFWTIPDGRLAAVLHHLRRATFTHRLSSGELDREAVDLTPDLVALALPRTCSRSDGSALRTASADDDARAAVDGSLLGPARWLSAFTAGDLAAVRYDGAHVSLEPAAEDAIDEAAGRAVTEALRETFDRHLADHPDRALEVHQLVVDTMGRHPAAFAVAVAPLAELLAAGGIEWREAWVGPAGSRWATPAEQARRRRLEELLATADGCCRRAARRSLDAWHTWAETATAGGDGGMARAEAGRVAEDLEHGPVAAVLPEVAAVGRPVSGLRRLGEWAAAVAAGAGTSGAGVQYVCARGADAAGDGPAAEAHLNSGLRIDPDHPACLGFLAELAEDRGDAQQSVALRRRAGRPPEPAVMRTLEPFLVDRAVGRNEPCPCGSGRKYKSCCSGGPIRRPLPDRGRWLLSRAARHAVRMDPLAVRSLEHLFEAPGGGEETAALAEDLLLFAHGGLARYLAARGTLLPADELDCARGWVDEPWRLLEVGAAGASGAVDVVDVQTGERFAVVGRDGAPDIETGQTVLTRALPVGELRLLSGAVVSIPDGGRARVAETLSASAGALRPFDLLRLMVDLQVDALRR